MERLTNPSWGAPAPPAFRLLQARGWDVIMLKRHHLAETMPSVVTLSPEGDGTITWTSSNGLVVLKAPLRRGDSSRGDSK
jgi:hypothetical protein